MCNIISTINKVLISFQRRKLPIVITYRDYNIDLKCYFAIKFYSIIMLAGEFLCRRIY